MTGTEIKELLKKKRIYQWEVADALRINEFTLSRWLRGEVDSLKEEDILSAISKIEEGGHKNG